MDVTDDRTRSDSGSTATTSVFGSPERNSQQQQLSLFDKLHATFDINEELPVQRDRYGQALNAPSIVKVEDNYDDSSSNSSFEGFRMT